MILDTSSKVSARSHDCKFCQIEHSEVIEFESGAKSINDLMKYDISRKLFEILKNIRIQHGGDFEEYLILYALLLASDYHHISASCQPKGKTINRRPQGVNLLSISDITQIPRETVRRKVAKLVADGSITRGDDGLHYYSGNAVQDDITAHILEGLPTVRAASAYGAPGGARRTIGKAV